MFRTLKKMPVPVAVLIMVVLILVGITLGNNNALKTAANVAEGSFIELQELLPDRAGKAANLVAMCNNLGIASAEAAQLTKAAEALKGAKTPKAVAAADQDLRTAADAVTAALKQTIDALPAQSKEVETRNLNAATDDLYHTTTLLNRAIRTYNGYVAEAQGILSRLPTQFLLRLFGAAPVMYPA